jgi:hypothetical protein
MEGTSGCSWGWLRGLVGIIILLGRRIGWMRHDVQGAKQTNVRQKCDHFLYLSGIVRGEGDIGIWCARRPVGMQEDGKNSISNRLNISRL